MKRKSRLNSPVGLALAVAGVMLALSPATRQAARRLMFKGTASLLSAGMTKSHSTTSRSKSVTTSHHQHNQNSNHQPEHLPMPNDGLGDTVADAAWKQQQQTQPNSVTDAIIH
ncbi:hypothetical protein JJB07_12400 [Tumebacillus sp. ITR2]|uniref:YtxH domain-containing protein n=1 Tax=Tumebacillus amylolyticus TaxID=2801339 RepID=A0ABS1JAZ9_9BACL|nr:hypothetical protein [Tumebacillus amylolyticus]MBL0387453.1 hypothetical protein [Tumebacillus amylolyticus]